MRAGVCGCKEWLGALHEAEQKACLDSKLHACGFVPQQSNPLPEHAVEAPPRLLHPRARG